MPYQNSLYINHIFFTVPIRRLINYDGIAGGSPHLGIFRVTFKTSVDFLECMSKSFLTNRPTNRPTDWFVQSRARGCKNWLHFLTAGQLDCAPSNAFFGDKATCNSYVSKDTVSQQYKKGLWFQWRANLKVNVVRFGFKNQPCGGDCVAQSPKR